MPLLYVNRLASMEALASTTRPDDRIRDAIERVLSGARIGSSGAFGPGRSTTADTWLDSLCDGLS